MPQILKPAGELDGQARVTVGCEADTRMRSSEPIATTSLTAALPYTTSLPIMGLDDSSPMTQLLLASLSPPFKLGGWA